MKNTISFPIRRTQPPPKKYLGAVKEQGGSSTKQIPFCFLCLLEEAWELAQSHSSDSFGPTAQPGPLAHGTTVAAKLTS